MVAVAMESHSGSGNCGTINATTWWWQSNQWPRAWLKGDEKKETKSIAAWKLNEIKIEMRQREMKSKEQQK